MTFLRSGNYYLKTVQADLNKLKSEMIEITKRTLSAPAFKSEKNEIASSIKKLSTDDLRTFIQDSRDLLGKLANINTMQIKSKENISGNDLNTLTTKSALNEKFNRVLLPLNLIYNFKHTVTKFMNTDDRKFHCAKIFIHLAKLPNTDINKFRVGVKRIRESLTDSINSLTLMKEKGDLPEDVKDKLAILSQLNTLLADSTETLTTKQHLKNDGMKRVKP